LRHNGGKIVPEAKGNEPFRHHEHPSEQQVSGIAHQRRLSTFKYKVPHDLRCDPDHKMAVAGKLRCRTLQVEHSGMLAAYPRVRCRSGDGAVP
jgi:hypothetical protein